MKILTIAVALAATVLSGCASSRVEEQRALLEQYRQREQEHQMQLAEMKKEQEKKELYWRLDKVEQVAQQRAPRNQECKIFCF